MNTITVTNTADNGVGSLREAILTAQTGDTITFDSSLANQTITLTSGQIEISAGKNLIIDGGNAANLTISGNNSSRIFHLDSNQDNISGLTIKNLNITEGYTDQIGGAILTEHLATLTVENVNFSDNVADEGGGAIYVQWEGTLTVTNSTFNNNEAIAANDERGAGAITFLSPGEFTIIDSDFTNNRGINGGAINSLNGKLTVENSRFINNDTTAAFYDEGNPRPFLRGFGGAIYTDRASSASDDTSGTISITNSVFSGNQGRGEGGAAYLYTGRQDSVVISDTLFENNEILALNGAPDGTFEGNGGAVVQQSDGLNQGFSVTNTTFANNTAASQGGGLWVMNAPTTITNSTFSGNQTLNQNPRSVGGGLTVYSPTEIVQSTFANNHAGWVGGAVSANDSTVTVQDSIFDRNTANNGGNNWGIQQHSNRELTDLGGNFQYPPKATNNFNDYNVTATIEITVDPQLESLQDNGGSVPTHSVGNTLAANSGVIFVDETPVDENPVEENPVDETPVEENPVEEIPVEETPVEETPVEENPVDDTPIEETPVEEIPIEENPVEENPVDETPIEETPVDETPVDEIPVEEIPIDETPVEENPIEETPVEENPVEENPVEEIPVEENPVDETPVEENPVDDTPIEETPVEEIPIEEIPVEENPIEENPIEETPIEETPVDETPVDEIPVEEIPIDETPVEENPIEETPVEENPVEENPVEENPVEENPVDETPVEEIPIEEIPVEENPIEETPIEETPVDETPVDEIPVEEIPVEENPVEEIPIEENPVEEIPVDDTPIEETPVDETPVDETPIDETPIDETPIEEIPIEEIPVDDTPIEETPIEENPVDETPVEETPVEENPVDETPIEEIPIDETPVDETPIEENPVEEIPVEENPVDETPIEEIPVEETPVDETPIEENPVEETPIDETPVDETPIEETPVNEIPVEEIPIDETPVDEIPIEETPVEETPIEETPINETPINETPTNETYDDDFDLIPEPDVTITPIEIEDNFNDNQDTVVDVIDGEIEEPEETNTTDIVVDAIDVEIQEEESGEIVAPTLNFQNDHSVTIESNEPVKLAFQLLENNSTQMYEIGVFSVEDEQGTVNSLTSEDEGYLQAALSQNQARVIFSTLSESEQPEGFEIQRERIIEGFDNNNRLVFYLVQSGSTDEVLTGQISEKQVIFGSSFGTNESELLQVEQSEDNQFILSWNEGNNGDNAQIVLNLQITEEQAPIGTALQGQSQRELIDLRSQTGELAANFTIQREAAFDNQAGLYIVDDEDGTVDGIAPGETGYATAALAKRVNNLELFAQEGQTNTENNILTGGVILAPYVIADGSVDEFLAQNSNNLPGEDTLAYFAYSGANPDNIDHIRLLGDNSFGFEDSFGGGDMDFNDLILEINF